MIGSHVAQIEPEQRSALGSKTTSQQAGIFRKPRNDEAAVRFVKQPNNQTIGRQRPAENPAKTSAGTVGKLGEPQKTSKIRFTSPISFVYYLCSLVLRRFT